MTENNGIIIVPRRLRLLVSIAVTLALSLGILAIQPAASQAAPERALIFTGQGPVATNFASFGDATGAQLDLLNTFPDDLSVYACVALPGQSQPFSTTQIAQLSAYLNDGGTVIAMTDNGAFTATITTMNSLFASLGSGMVVDPAFVGALIQTTTMIDPSPLTDGVDSINYSSTSTLSIGGNAQSLVRVQSGTPFIGAEEIGQGLLVVSGDTNVFATMTFDPQANQGNRTLSSNLCQSHSNDDEPPPPPPPPPVPGAVSITIDLKPYGKTTEIVAHSHGAIQLAVFGSDDLDVSDLDVNSLRLGPAGASPEKSGRSYGKLKDENHDGITDLRLKFRASDTGLQPGDTQVCLTGRLMDGTNVSGCTSVRVVNKNGGKKDK